SSRIGVLSESGAVRSTISTAPLRRAASRSLSTGMGVSFDRGGPTGGVGRDLGTPAVRGGRCLVRQPLTACGERGSVDVAVAPGAGRGGRRRAAAGGRARADRARAPGAPRPCRAGE